MYTRVRCGAVWSVLEGPSTIYRIGCYPVRIPCPPYPVIFSLFCLSPRWTSHQSLLPNLRAVLRNTLIRASASDVPSIPLCYIMIRPPLGVCLVLLLRRHAPAWLVYVVYSAPPRPPRFLFAPFFVSGPSNVAVRNPRSPVVHSTTGVAFCTWWGQSQLSIPLAACTGEDLEAISLTGVRILSKMHKTSTTSRTRESCRTCPILSVRF